MALARGTPRSEIIATLNDNARWCRDPTARHVVTAACLATLAPEDSQLQRVWTRAKLLQGLRKASFTRDAPERDHAAFEVDGHRLHFKIDLYEETVVKNTFCVSFPVRLPAPLPPYSDPIDWLRSFRGQLMHNPCIDLYPVEAEAAYHNPYSHPRIEQRRMRTKLLLGVSSRSYS